MDQPIVLEAQFRELLGKKTRRLRRQGVIPVHLYGRGVDSMSLQAEAATLQKAMAQAGPITPISVRVSGQEHMVVVRQVQRHPATGRLLHVDFLQVSVTEKMRTEVPIHLVGTAPAIRLQSGVLSQAIHTVLVEALPLEMPRELEADVSGLDDFEKVVRVGDIRVGPGITVLTDPEAVVARVGRPRVVEEAVAEAKPAEAAPVAEAEAEEKK